MSRKTRVEEVDPQLVINCKWAVEDLRAAQEKLQLARDARDAAVVQLRAAGAHMPEMMDVFRMSDTALRTVLERHRLLHADPSMKAVSEDFD